jgi:D-sedoheptulose 7-phosphate isomerase
MKEKIKDALKENISVKQGLLQDKHLCVIEKIIQLTISCLKDGGKIILFGNGGSAADAQHIAAEFVGRFKKERKALAAIALNTNSSNLTCLANDYGFEQVYSRQIEALALSRDLVIGISTSGNSPNIIAGISQAKKMGIKTCALTSEKGKKLAQTVDLALCVPAQDTARIQEAHITVGHIICELTELALL